MLKYIKTDSDSVLGICLFKQEEQEIWANAHKMRESL